MLSSLLYVDASVFPNNFKLLHVKRDALLEFLKKQRKANLFLVSLVVISLIALLDTRLAQEISLSLFYLLPVFLTAWYLGRAAGVAIILLTAGLWTLSEYLTFANVTLIISLWNLLIRIGLFYSFTYLLLTLKKGLEREAELSRTDPLTGAANARAFYETAQRELERSERYSSVTTVVYFDLDNFKAVNDRFGHQTGDELLRSVVRLLQRNVRATDTVTRMGGDEFVILMPETDQHQAESAVTKLRPLLLDVMQTKGWPVTFSIGVYTFRKPPKDVSVMIQRVDELMYTVKRGTKDGVAFSSDTDDAAHTSAGTDAPASGIGANAQSPE